MTNLSEDQHVKLCDLFTNFHTQFRINIFTIEPTDIILSQHIIFLP